MRLFPFAALFLVATPTLAAPPDDDTAIALARPQGMIVGQRKMIRLSPTAVAAVLAPVGAF